MQIPLIGGTGVDKKTQRNVNKMNVNAIPKAGETPSGKGYITHHNGIDLLYTLDGVSNGVKYNYLTSTEYRAYGGNIYAGSDAVTPYDGKRTKFAYSRLTTAFIDSGLVKFINSDGSITEFKNWVEGERYNVFADDEYVVNYDKTGRTYIEIPPFNMVNGLILNFTIDYQIKTGDTADRQYIMYALSSGSDNQGGGVWVNVSDNGVYYQLEWGVDKPVKLYDLEDGVNNVSIVIPGKFNNPISYICGDTFRSGGMRNKLTGMIIYDIAGTDNRKYNLTTMVTHGEAPTTTSILDTYKDEEGSENNGTLYTIDPKWVLLEEGEQTASPATEYIMNGFIDVCRNRERYIALKPNEFIISSITAPANGGTLEPVFTEQRPDEDSAVYTAENTQDDNKAVFAWDSFVVVMKRTSIEWFSLTGNAGNEYASNTGMITSCGVIGTHAVSEYGDNFIGIGSPAGDDIGVYILAPNQYKMISNEEINLILNDYKESELVNVVVNAISYDSDEWVYIHLPNETFVYSTANQSWSKLKTGLDDDVWRGIDLCNNPEVGITIGDKLQGNVGVLNDAVSSQYGSPIEFEIYTKMFQVGNGRVPQRMGSLSFNTVSGYENYAKNLWLSFTSDGVTFGNEMMIPLPAKYDYTKSNLVNNLGVARGDIGFKVRGQITNGLNICSFTIGG